MITRPVTRNSQSKNMPQSAPEKGVGGRHTDTTIPIGGGGYLDICIKKIFPDPRLVELKRMGLAQRWLDIAAQIGVDQFYVVWRILDTSGAEDVGGGLRLWIPRLKLLERYQRNRYIQSLSERGLTAKEITKLVRRKTDHNLSHRHVLRIISQWKNDNDE